MNSDYHTLADENKEYGPPPKYEGFYRGYVIQNNDPERAGRVKLFIPLLAQTVYESFLDEREADKIMHHISEQPSNEEPGSDISKIIDRIKAVSYWAEQASPLMGQGSAGYYKHTDKKITNNDNADKDKKEEGEDSFTEDGIGVKPGHAYETFKYALSGHFSSLKQDQTHQANVYDMQYKPSTYTNRVKGSFSIPNVGACVWLFFEGGFWSRPVYFAYGFDNLDWQNIYDTEGKQGKDYPNAYENTKSTTGGGAGGTGAGSTGGTTTGSTGSVGGAGAPGTSSGSDETIKYKNKYVLNQKGATIEITNTDNDERYKVSHYNGSFFEYNTFGKTELVVGSEQRLVKEEQFESVELNKNLHVLRDYNIRTNQNINYRVGSLDYEKYQKWKEIWNEVAQRISLFSIQRSKKIETKGSVKQTSDLQTRSGSYDINPVLLHNYYEPLTLGALKPGYLAAPPKVTSNADPITDYTNFLDEITKDPAKNLAVPKAPIVAALPDVGQFEKAAGTEGSNNFTGEEGPAKSASTWNGSWASEPEKARLAAIYKDAAKKLIDIEKEMGVGGDGIEEITRHKETIVGATINTYPATRVDERGYMDFNEVLISEFGAFASSKESSLVEKTGNDRPFPCGNWSIVCGNSFSVDAGSGGISTKTTGVYDVAGAMVNITGRDQVNVQSIGDIFLESKGRISITADILTLRQLRYKQVGIDGSLGVKHNIIIGGSAYVDGELYVQHITAPVEYQATEEMIARGYLRNPAVGGVADPAKSSSYIPKGTILAEFGNLGFEGLDGTPTPVIVGYDADDRPVYLNFNFKVKAYRAAGLDTYPDASYTETPHHFEVNEAGTAANDKHIPVHGRGYTGKEPSKLDGVEIFAHSHHFKNIPLTLMENDKEVRKAAMPLNKGNGRGIAKSPAHTRKKNEKFDNAADKAIADAIAAKADEVEAALPGDEPILLPASNNPGYGPTVAIV